MLYLFYPAGITKLVHKVGEKYEILANILRPELEEDVRAVVKRLPIMSVRLEMGGQKVLLGRLRESQARWIPVSAGAEVTNNKKPKNEGMVVGNSDTRDLAALEKVGAVRGLTTFSLHVSWKKVPHLVLRV